MIQVLHNSADISSKVFGITPIQYRTNDDFTFELPETSIQTTISTAVIGDTVTVLEPTTARQVEFYIDKITYDYRRKTYSWQCPHILQKLSKVKAKEVAVAWAGISPSYAQYNSQNTFVQGQSIWARRYFQVLFLMQILIRKATGMAISGINIDVGTKDSFYYTRYNQPPNGWVDIRKKYADLAVCGSSVYRLGTNTHLDAASTDFDVLSRLPNALQLLRWLCASTGLVIDIFRSDYKILTFTFSSAPSDNATKQREDRLIDRYRRYRTSTKLLDTGSYDYIYGVWDTSTESIRYYTYGVQNADYELTSAQVEEINSTVNVDKTLDLPWPNMFKLYSINNDSTYQSHIAYIMDYERDLGFVEQWMDMLYNTWQGITQSNTYELIIPGLYMHHRSVELDLEARKMKYESLL